MVEWIKVEDRLPLQDIEKGVYGKRLVTVYPKHPDRNDEPEVMFLWFSNSTNCFSYRPEGKPYEDENEYWRVTHWAECPKPAKGWNQP